MPTKPKITVTYYYRGAPFNPQDLPPGATRLPFLDGEKLDNGEYHSPLKPVAQGNYGQVSILEGIAPELQQYFSGPVAVKRGIYFPRREEDPRNEACFFSSVNNTLTIVLTKYTPKEKEEEAVSNGAAAGGDSVDKKAASSAAAGSSTTKSGSTDKKVTSDSDKAKSAAKKSGSYSYKIFMTYYSGATLLKATEEGINESTYSEKFKLAMKLLLLLFVTKRLDEVHQKNCIHGDVKPNNIIVILNDKGSIADIRFIDFGISYQATATQATYYPNSKAEYISIDRKRVRPPVPDIKQDLFSLSYSFYKYCLTEDERKKCQFLKQAADNYTHSFLGTPLEKDQKLLSNSRQFFLAVIDELKKLDSSDTKHICEYIRAFTTERMGNELIDFYEGLLASVTQAADYGAAIASSGSCAADAAAAGGGDCVVDAAAGTPATRRRSDGPDDTAAGGGYASDVKTDSNGDYAAATAKSSHAKSWCSMFRNLADQSRKRPCQSIGIPGRSLS